MDEPKNGGRKEKQVSGLPNNIATENRPDGGMGMKKPLPIGIENFEDMVTSGYYYVDKTLFIKELLDLGGKVNLFTRPRRFGKTLNLSMLRYFFEETGDTGKNAQNKALFQGMKILGAGDAYTCHMGK